MKCKELELSGALLIDLEPRIDDRGYFMRLFCSEELKKMGFDQNIAQINFSHTDKKFAIRGLHFQYPPYAETKIVHCLKGRILDVIVDIRKDSPTFLKHLAIELSEKKAQAILIPEGFAHGFQTLENNTELIYFHSKKYAPDCEGGLYYADPKLNIEWPQPPSEISSKDAQRTKIDSNFKGIEL